MSRRNNNTDTEEEASPSLGSQLDAFLAATEEFLVNIHDNLRTLDTENIDFWRSLALAVVLSVVYYAIVKWFFGQFAMTFNIVAAIFVFQNLKSRTFATKDRNFLVDPQQKQQQQRPGESGQKVNKVEEEESYENEFDYNVNAKPSRFRPRSRPYKPRDRSMFVKNDKNITSQNGSE